MANADERLYARYATALAGEPLPRAVVDLDAVDRNVDTLLAPVRRANKTLRIASKSIRCLALMRHIVARGGDAMKGVMAYSAREAAWLVAQGERDVLLAYPTLHRGDLALVARANAGDATLSVVVDCLAHVDALDAAGAAHGVVLPAVVEVDMALRRFGGRVHLGVRRSPLRTADDVVILAARIAERRFVRFFGVMGYESQVAGLGDDNPFDPRMNGPKRLIRALSRRAVAALRSEIFERLVARGLPPAIFNGGGTGSLDSATTEVALTEVTAGSGFVASHLFDYYRHLALTPALFFALQVVRAPDPGIVTCAGGGYVASGPPSRDRLPLPWLPRGLRTLALEGAGEVQTPLTVPRGLVLGLGDVVLFRHAKAGELAEHFNEYLLVRGDLRVGVAPTYRGMGGAFLG